MTGSSQVATFAVFLGMLPLSQLEAGRIQSIQVVDDLDALSTFSITLSAWDTQMGRWAWDDSGPLDLGTEVDIRLGFQGDVATVLVGEVTEHELSIGAGSSPSLTVHGYTPLHRLERGIFSRSWDEASEVTILSAIAGDHGLLARATDLSSPDARVVQLEQSDYQFLKGRGAKLGYDLFYADGALQFHPKPEGETEPITLSAQSDLISFSARKNTKGQADSVSMTYRDSEQSAPVELLVSYDGPEEAGPNVAKGLFKSARVSASARTLDDKAEAERQAQARLDALAERFITAQVTCRGRNTLRSGAIVEFPDVGAAFSGRYRVVRVTHSLRAGQTYQTSFSARRVL